MNDKIYALFDRLTYNRDKDVEITFIVKGYVNKALASQLKEGTLFRLDLKEVKAKRSLEQNAYMWALIHEISVARNTERATENDDWDVYIEALERAQAKFSIIAVKPEAMGMLKESFRAMKELNRFVTEKGVEMAQCKVFYGSSKMDVQEMAKLLDVVIDMAEESGVPVQEKTWSY